MVVPTPAVGSRKTIQGDWETALATRAGLVVSEGVVAEDTSLVWLRWVPPRGKEQVTHEIRRSDHRVGTSRSSFVLSPGGPRMERGSGRKGQARRHLYQHRMHPHEDDGSSRTGRSLRTKCRTLGCRGS